jgi:hypothetical protein
VTLLNYVAEAPVDLSLKQIAAVAFKNYVKTRWVPSEEVTYPIIHEDIKAVIRQNLFQFMLGTHSLISK